MKWLYSRFELNEYLLQEADFLAISLQFPSLPLPNGIWGAVCSLSLSTRASPRTQPVQGRAVCSLAKAQIGAVVFPFLAGKASSELMPSAQPLCIAQRQDNASSNRQGLRGDSGGSGGCAVGAFCGPRGLFILLEKLGSS